MFSYEQLIDTVTKDPVRVISLFTIVLHFTAIVYFVIKSFYFSDKTQPCYEREPGYIHCVHHLTQSSLLVFAQFVAVNDILPHTKNENAVTLIFGLLMIATTITLFEILIKWKDIYVYTWSTVMFEWIIKNHGHEYAITLASLNNTDKVNLLYNAGIIHNKNNLGKFAYLLNIQILEVNYIDEKKI